LKNKSMLFLMSVFGVLILAAIFSISGCGTSQEQEVVDEAVADEFHLAVLFPGTVEFFSIQQEGMDEAAEEFGVRITYADAEWDAGKQLSQVENFVASGVDAIVLCAADNEALLPAIDICNSAEIPLITFTNTVGPNPDGSYEGIVTFIGTNEVTTGRLLGEMAEQLLGGEDGKIVVIEGNPGTAPQRLRRQGFDEILANHDNWEVVYSQAIQGWTKEGSLAMMEDFIQTGTEFNLVSCQWSTAALAAAQALTEAGQLDGVYVTGVEFTSEAVPFIQDGSVDMLSFYSVKDLGYITIENTFKFLNGEQIPSFIEVFHEIVNINNLDQFEPEM
jgi:ABC-type sugar transport system substrate-binding protein